MGVASDGSTPWCHFQWKSTCISYTYMIVYSCQLRASEQINVQMIDFPLKEASQWVQSLDVFEWNDFLFCVNHKLYVISYACLLPVSSCMLPETTADTDSKAQNEAVSQCHIRLKVVLYTEIYMYLLSLECPSPLLGGIRKESWEPRFLVCCDPVTRADSK